MICAGGGESKEDSRFPTHHFKDNTPFVLRPSAAAMSSSLCSESVAVYRRRPKASSSSAADAATEIEENHDRNGSKSPNESCDQNHTKSFTRRRGQSSWVARSLSARGSTNTMNAHVFAANVSKSNQTILSPNAHRRKRVGAPADFVQEQKNYFSQVDAFELEEDISPQKDSWTNEPKARDAAIPNVQFSSRRLLQLVQEGTPENLTSLHVTSPWRECIEHMLKTPHGDQVLGVDSLKGVCNRATDDIGVPQEHIGIDNKRVISEGGSYDFEQYLHVKSRYDTTDLERHKPASDSVCCPTSPESRILIDIDSDGNVLVQDPNDSSSPGDAGRSAVSTTKSGMKAPYDRILCTPECIDSRSYAFEQYLHIRSRSNTPGPQQHEPESESVCCSASPESLVLIDVDNDGKVSLQDPTDSFSSGDVARTVISKRKSGKSSPYDIDLSAPEYIDLDTPECKPLHYNPHHVKCEDDTSGRPNSKNMALCSVDEYNAAAGKQNANAESVPVETGLDDTESDLLDCGVNNLRCQHDPHAITITPTQTGRKMDEQGSVTEGQRVAFQKREAESNFYSNGGNNLNDDLSELTEGMHALRFDDRHAQEPTHLHNIQDIKRCSQLAKEPRAFEGLLRKCGQKEPLKLKDALSEFSNMTEIRKLGEGTYGEAFKGSNSVFKIVPMGGDLLVNGEVQKSFLEMYTEVLLCLTLNKLRGANDCPLQSNICTNFIDTKTVRVCRGAYDEELINAWEEWDAEHGSENDHPNIFQADQLYMLFVLADGGKDLESFVVSTFDVARSILIQVTAALAVAEEACEFEHRDLHWGNILVSQRSQPELFLKLNGTDVVVKTYGVFVQIIDFTLSRLHTGTEVLFADLSTDPALFEGRKGDIQAETYRRMLHLTENQWSSSFLKTNCYWIHYLAEILLTKKLAVHKLKSNREDAKELRAFKKRTLSYDSAKMCLEMDPLFDTMKR